MYNRRSYLITFLSISVHLHGLHAMLVDRIAPALKWIMVITAVAQRTCVYAKSLEIGNIYATVQSAVFMGKRRKK